jgi:hypothetical protein
MLGDLFGFKHLNWFYFFLVAGQWHGSGDDGVRICRARAGVELHAC